MNNQRPDKSLILGHSADGSLEDAIKHATSQLTQDSAAGDLRVDFVVEKIMGQFGGFLGQRDLFVELRLDQDIAQELPSVQPAGPHASRVGLLNKALEKLEIVSLSSAPPQFLLRGEREMPTPGWSFHVDSIRSDGQGHITVYITDIPPAADAPAQMIVPTVLSIQLGGLRQGRYVVELHTRRSPSERYRLLQADVLEAQ